MAGSETSTICLQIPYEWLPRLSERTRNELIAMVVSNGHHQENPEGDGAANKKPVSYPLSEAEAREVVSGIDARTAAVLKRIAENYSAETGRGEIDYPEARELAGARDWGHFAKGHLSGLTRRLRKVTQDPRAVLVYWNDNEGWEDDNAGDYKSGKLYIDRPAVMSLRSHFGLD